MLEKCNMKARFASFMEAFALEYYLFIYLTTIFLSLFVCIFIVFTPFLWGFAALYLVWFYFDRNASERGGYLWHTMRTFKSYDYLVSYFSANLIKTAELPPDKNYIVGSHPHGILNFGTFISFGTEATGFSSKYPGLTSYLVTLPMNFWIPFRREYLLLSGFISSNREAIGALLRHPHKGNMAVLVPGGAEESLEAHPGNYNIVLAKRKGFVRLALKYGADLVPCYNFGEQMVYKQLPNPRGSWVRKFQELLKKSFGATLPLFYGRCTFSERFVGLMPLRTQITTVVGAPINVTQVTEPSEAEVDALHAQYCQALKALFNEHKLKYDKMATEETELNII